MPKIAVPPKDLKLSVAISTEDSVDDMVAVLGHLRVANTPLADVFKLDEALLNPELALVLIVHVYVVEESALTGRLWDILCQSRLFHVFHGEADPVWPDIPRPENRLMFPFVHELMAFIRRDH